LYCIALKPFKAQKFISPQKIRETKKKFGEKIQALIGGSKARKLVSALFDPYLTYLYTLNNINFGEKSTDPRQ